MDDTDRLTKFSSRLSGLGRTRRSATKQRDYVLAVWTDCPKYILPQNFRTLSLPLLLEDAILQLEKNFAKSIPVTAMAGLFDSLEASALWRPSRYLDEIEVSHVRQVYGTVVSECALLPITEGRGVPLNLHHQDLGRSSNIQDFKEFFHRKRPAEVIEYMQQIVALWPSGIIERVTSASPVSFQNHLEGLQAACRSIILSGHSVLKAMMSAAIAGDSHLQDAFSRFTLNMLSADTNVYDTVLELVSDALGLDSQFCRHNAALHLVIYPSNHPSIGFLNRSKRDLEFHIDDDQMMLDRVTVCRDVAGSGTGCTLLEAVRVRSQQMSRSKCYATGVWVPQEITPVTDVRGFLDVESPNAMLV